jgi:hypothetical protein
MLLDWITNSKFKFNVNRDWNKVSLRQPDLGFNQALDFSLEGKELQVKTKARDLIEVGSDARATIAVSWALSRGDGFADNWVWTVRV